MVFELCLAFVFGRQYAESIASRWEGLLSTPRVSLTYAVQSVPLCLCACLPFCLYCCDRARLSVCRSPMLSCKNSVLLYVDGKTSRYFWAKIEEVQVEGSAIRSPAHFLRIQMEFRHGLPCAPNVSALPAGRRPKYMHAVLVCILRSTG